MKARFPGYYRPSNDEFADLWAKCFFVPDANILLHLFRYGEKTRAQVLDTLTRLKPRLWIPYRVGFEFQRRWRDVDQLNRDAYDKLSREIEGQGRKLAALFDEYTRHQLIDVKVEQKTINEFVGRLCDRLAESKTKHPSRADAEKIFLEITELVGDAVGIQPPKANMEELIKEGQVRYEASVPPGYSDNKKDVPDRYGDFFIWREVLEKAKNEKKPIVVITDDVKEDWWQEFRGEKIGPRAELIEEMNAFAGQKFYLYTLSQFLDYASNFLKRKVDNEAIEEIKSDELQRRTIARRAREDFHISPTLLFLLERRLRSERRAIREHLAKIDSEIENLEHSSDAQELSRAPILLKERREVLDSLRQNGRSLSDLRDKLSLRTSTSRDNANTGFTSALLRWLASNTDRNSTHEIHPEGTPSSNDDPGDSHEDEKA